MSSDPDLDTVWQVLTTTGSSPANFGLTVAYVGGSCHHWDHHNHQHIYITLASWTGNSSNDSVGSPHWSCLFKEASQRRCVLKSIDDGCSIIWSRVTNMRTSTGLEEIPSPGDLSTHFDHFHHQRENSAAGAKYFFYECCIQILQGQEVSGSPSSTPKRRVYWAGEEVKLL